MHVRASQDNHFGVSLDIIVMLMSGSTYKTRQKKKKKTILTENNQ